MLFALSGIGAIGFGVRHPVDYVWNHGVRNLVGSPLLRPNAPRQRDAFKVGTAWLIVVGDAPGHGSHDRRARARRGVRRGMRHRHHHQSLPAIRDVAWLERHRTADDPITIQGAAR